MARDCGQALGAESRPLLTAREKMGLSVSPLQAAKLC